MRATREFCGIVRSLALFAGLGAALTSQAAMGRHPANLSAKELAELLKRTPAQKFEWSYRGCKRVDVPTGTSERPTPALSVVTLNDGDVRLKATIKAPNDEIRTGYLELPSSAGDAKHIGFQAKFVRELSSGHRVWVATFDRYYNQSFHDLGLKQIAYEEIGSSPANLKRVITLTTNLTEDVRSVFEGGLVYVWQYSSDGDFLDRVVETKPSGSWFKRVYTVSRQQVLGQCGNGFHATTPDDWAGTSAPAMQNVPDSVAEQQKFALFIPNLKTAPPETGSSVDVMAINPGP